MGFWQFPLLEAPRLAWLRVAHPVYGFFAIENPSVSFLDFSRHPLGGNLLCVRLQISPLSFGLGSIVRSIKVPSGRVVAIRRYRAGLRLVLAATFDGGLGLPIACSLCGTKDKHAELAICDEYVRDCFEELGLVVRRCLARVSYLRGRRLVCIPQSQPKIRVL